MVSRRERNSLRCLSSSLFNTKSRYTIYSLHVFDGWFTSKKSFPSKLVYNSKPPNPSPSFNQVLLLMAGLPQRRAVLTQLTLKSLTYVKDTLPRTASTTTTTTHPVYRCLFVASPPVSQLFIISSQRNVEIIITGLSLKQRNDILEETYISEYYKSERRPEVTTRNS